MKNKRNYLKQNGITLIALIVTIVILLILAGVTLNAVFSDNGIIKKAQDAQTKTDQGMQKDLEPMGALEDLINKNAGEGKSEETIKISTIVGKGAVTKNTKVVDAYENKIIIPKGFKVLPHNPTSSTGAVTYTYNEDNTPAVQDGIVIEDKDGNQFVWVPVGTINNKDNTTNTITLGRYSNFTAQNGIYTPAQSAENYTDEIEVGKTNKENYTIAKLSLQSEIKINKAIQLENTLDNVKIMTTATEPIYSTKAKELNTFREGAGQLNTTARDLKTFIETSLANGGYYIARFEASGTINRIESKYNQIVLTDIGQSKAADLAREMYGEVKENNELVYASDLVNSYAWDTAIIFIQTYSTETDANNYSGQNKSTSFANAGINNDKYCNIWDMSGNASEWTTEYGSEFDENPCMARGGWYYETSGFGPRAKTSNRCSNGATKSDTRTGLRALIYVK